MKKMANRPLQRCPRESSIHRCAQDDVESKLTRQTFAPLRHRACVCSCPPALAAGVLRHLASRPLLLVALLCLCAVGLELYIPRCPLLLSATPIRCFHVDDHTSTTQLHQHLCSAIGLISSDLI